MDDARATRKLNKTELARAAGLSRTTVSQALSQSAPPPTKITVAAVARPLRLPVAPLLDLLTAATDGASLVEKEPPRHPRHVFSSAVGLPGAIEDLLERQRDLGELWPYVIQDGSGARQPLSQIYIPQMLIPSATTDEMASTDTRTHVEAALSSPNHGHLLVETGPGGGKSTLMTRLAGQLSQRLLERSGGFDGSLIPLWTTASHLAASHDGVDLALSRLIFGDAFDAERRFSKAVRGLMPPESTWLILVDGLDEISGVSERAQLTRRLSTLAGKTRQDEARTRFIVASRPMKRVERNAFHRSVFSRWTVAPFDDSQLREFSLRWFGGEDAGDRQAQEFLRQVELAGLQDLMANPLLAAVAAAVYEAWPERGLPANRYALYEQYRVYLMSAKSLQRETHLNQLASSTLRDPVVLDSVRFLRDRFDDLLRHLAQTTVKETAPDLLRIALAWLAEQLGPRARSSIPGWGEQVTALLTTSGLVVSGEERLRFLHVSFAEHLAAEAESLHLPARFDPEEVNWKRVLQLASYDRGANAQAARATLLHFAHGHPGESEQLLTWLQGGTNLHQRTAGFLLAEGSPATPVHVAAFLNQLPFLSSDCWQMAGHLADPSASEKLRAFAMSASHPQAMRDQALAALSLRHPSEAEEIRSRLAALELDERGWQASAPAAPSSALEPWTSGDFFVDLETSAMTIVLEQFSVEDLRAQALTLSDLVCDGSLDRFDRMVVIYRLCEAAPEVGQRTAERLQHIACDAQLDVWSRYFAAEALIDFGGSYLVTAATALTSIVEDRHSAMSDRLAAAECLADLPGHYVARAYQLIIQLTQEDIANPVQRLELQEALDQFDRASDYYQ
ncbi:NACHT domain-containing protein [[Kitasatospora] papulosa]|uniref:NACHT domain-containing protein n=1 Tax=Streptomyces TaxID=1883 RepID=UPI002FEF387F